MAGSETRILSDESLHKALGAYGIEPSRLLLDQIREYLRLLVIWNEKVSLTAITHPLDILHRHFGESMFAAGAVPIESGRLADVGSGAGFPGMALKLIRPELEVFLIESNVKKAMFLAEVTRQLDLSGVKVVVNRFEDLADTLAPIDFVCSRALGSFRELLDWSGHTIHPKGKVAFWVGSEDAKKISADSRWTWREPIPIPASLRRCILVGSRKN